MAAFCNSEGCLTYIGSDRAEGITSFDVGHLTPIASDYLAKNLLVKLVTGNYSVLKGDYRTMPPQRDFVEGMDNFPAETPLATIRLNLESSKTIKAISISAIAEDGTDLGNWTTQPTTHLWGIGIFNDSNVLANKGSRKTELDLMVAQNLSLLIPDNGNLPRCPKLYIELLFSDGTRTSTFIQCQADNPSPNR